MAIILRLEPIQQLLLFQIVNSAAYPVHFFLLGVNVVGNAHNSLMGGTSGYEWQ